MKITDLLKPEGIKVGATASSQDDAMNQLIKLQDASGNISDTKAYKEALLAREAEFSTAVGDGIAIPHAKTAAVKRPGLAAMTIPAGVEWNAPDDAPVTLVFMIAAPEGENNAHLEMLAQLSRMLMHPEFANALRDAKSPEEFLAVIDKSETASDEAAADASSQKAAAESAGDWPQVLAITACPTGIAHTYMAAENLEKKANEMGVSIKVETQGSAGAKNVLTADEVAHAKGIIIAADKNVDRARFGGKPVYSTNVSAGINEPEKLINIILNNEAPIQEGTTAASSGESAEEKDSVWHVIYKHLMNGISHMLPFVIGGGLLTAIAFLIDQPGLGTANYGSSIPAAAFFKTIGNEAMGMMLPILAAYIAMSIADRPGLVAGFVGGLFAKAGYSIGYLTNLISNPDAAQAACVSGGFIAALFAGFAAGYLVLGVEKLCDHMPASLEGIKPMLIYPLAGTLLTGAVMFVLNPVFGAINTGLNSWLSSMGTTNLVLLGAIVGGMMSIDMGGPFNKAAYAFSIGVLAEGTTAGQTIMAACMVGGMVPPIVIALSTTFFKDKWTKADRDAGIVNYIMGLSFISEGAIPFAAADPGRVIPSCVIGSAIAGALSAAFGCTSPAPHGGAWIIAVIGNPVMYLVALAVGSVIGCLILSFWKKPLPASESGLVEKAKA